MRINSTVTFTAKVDDFAAQGYKKKDRHASWAMGAISSRKPGTEDWNLFDNKAYAEIKQFTEAEPRLVRKKPENGKPDIKLGDNFVLVENKIKTTIGKFLGIGELDYCNSSPLSEGGRELGPSLLYKGVDNKKGKLPLLRGDDIYTVDEYTKEVLIPEKTKLVDKISEFFKKQGNNVAELSSKLSKATPDNIVKTLDTGENLQNLNTLGEILPTFKKYAQLIEIEKKIKTLIAIK